MLSGGRDRSTKQNRPTSSFITAYENGSRGGERIANPKKKEKSKEDMYNRLCGQEAELRPSDGLPPLAAPRTLAAFLMGFLRLLFISLNIQIIRTILSCQIKKIYRGSLEFFSTTKKEGMVNTFQREQATVKNTSLNINTIVPTLSEH